jgi:hypothetical protein
MLIFCGFDLEVFIEGALDRAGWPTLCCARDFMGGEWLIVQLDDEPLHLERTCAPASERAMQAVGTAIAGPADVLCHSATRRVELVRVDHCRAVPDGCLVCDSVSEYLPSWAERLVAVVA